MQLKYVFNIILNVNVKDSCLDNVDSLAILIAIIQIKILETNDKHTIYFLKNKSCLYLP
jgi:hypothetical protein